MMKTAKEDLISTCETLRKNDPRYTKLDLTPYSTLLVDRKRVQRVVQALEKNTVVEDLLLPYRLCADSALQLSHFLRSSPSLRHLAMEGKPEDAEEINREFDILKTSIVIESISRSSSLVKFSLCNVVFGDHCPLEDFLSSTRTLLDFSFTQNYFSTMTYGTAQAIGSGFAKNKSLVKLKWSTPDGLDFMGEVLFGLFDHNKLKSLELEVTLTESSSQVLRSLLHCNKTMERFQIKLHGFDEEFPTLASVLAGLANNKGLKEVLIQFESTETDTTLATAWTDMLQRNTFMKSLDLAGDGTWEGDYDYNLSSAVAEGLVNNSTLETVRLPHEDGYYSDNSFNGPVWQEMLEKNRSLKTLSFAQCLISVEGFQSLARGLSCNTSLETLDLSYTDTDIGDPCVIALVDGLRNNKTLKSLDLSQNCPLSQSGRDAIERLLGYNVLRELNMFLMVDSSDAATFTNGLSANRSIERLNVEATFARGESTESTETFRALCESLRGNTTLRYLTIGYNDVRLNGVCATALELNTTSLVTLDLNSNNVTSCGIAAIAQGLQGPCSLKELSLDQCSLTDTGLLLLGEALTTNVSLEILDVDRNDFTHDGVSQFFGLLPQMSGLKVVYGLVATRNDIAPTEALGLALIEGLQKSTKLQKIFKDASVETVYSSFSLGVARKIIFYLSLNSCGRTLLRLPTRSEPPSGLWPRMLAKISGPRDTSLLFYFLRNKPKIVNFKAAASRKRRLGNKVHLQTSAELDEARDPNAAEDAPTESFAVRQTKNDGSE
jgi:Ran GTPase-activating protein (RanGAP) involved in mRNA processing and transport